MLSLTLYTSNGLTKIQRLSYLSIIILGNDKMSIVFSGYIFKLFYKNDHYI